jgi:AraC-like DNA-binding protein
MKGYERATKEEINDRLRIEENCHAQVERIIYIRHLCNLNLEEAADVTNLSISTLSRYENEVTKCSVQSLITIYYTIRNTSTSSISPSTRTCFS